MREVFPEAEDMWLAEYAEVAQTGIPKRFVDRNEGLDRWFDVYVFPTNAPRERMQLAALFSDVTERERAEQTLRAGEERLRLALDAAEMGSFAWYPGENRMEADAKLRGLFGLPADTPIAHAAALMEVVHPEDRGRNREAVAQACDPAGDGQLRGEIRVCRPDGSERWLAIHARATFAGHPRRAVRLTGVAVDVTDRKRIEEQQGFVLRLSDALRPLADAKKIQGTAMAMLRAQLGAGWCYYVEWNEDAGVGVVLQDSAGDGLPSLAGVYPVSDVPEFVEFLRSGQILKVRDAANYELLSSRIRQRYASAGFRSLLGVPLVKDGRLAALLVVGDTQPRDWPASSVSLAGEVADRTWATLVRARAESALRDSEERFRLLVDNVQEYALFQTDVQGNVTSWNPGAERLFGYATAEMLGQPAACLFTSGDQEAGVPKQEMARTLAGQRQQDARSLVRKDGSVFWAQWVTEPVRDAAGELRGVVTVLRDETDRKRSEERQQLLMGELSHRVKNTLATVQAIAKQTLRGTADPRDFTDRFLQRLQALARAHDLLTRSNWEGADIRVIVREQLQLPAQEGRISVAGPPAFLDAQSSLALALVLHELATNARKYGALSVPEGHLFIQWDLGTEQSDARLQLLWEERGGPPVRAPERHGFGMTLVSLSLRGVGGSTALHFDEEGVRCRLEVPLGTGPGTGLSRKDIQFS
jgi:PAS domain S-box-containing protein